MKTKEELKKKGLSDAIADRMSEIIDTAFSIRGTSKVMGSFTVEVDDSMNVVISAISGWKVIYPPLCSAWCYLAAWLSDWEESSNIMEIFVKTIVFPSCNRIEGIDGQYIKDIIKANEELDKRNSGKVQELTDEEREEELNAAEMAEAVIREIVSSGES